MPRYLVQDFLRERPGGTGAAGGTAQFYLASGVPVGPSATTDVDGKFNLLDEVYPGLGYYTVTKAGVTKKHDMRSVGFIGTVSAADIVTFFQGFATNGILKNVLSEFAISPGGGLNISVAPGGGVIAGHPFRFSLAQSRASATAHVSLPRIDRMVASLVPPGAAVGSPGAITIKVVGGVAAASPAAPALVSTADEIQINLGTWTVAAGATSPSSLIPEAVRSIPGTHAHPISDVTGLQAALDAKQAIDATLTAFAAYNTAGLLTQTAADSFTGRAIAAADSKIVVTNGNGASGNPTIGLGPHGHVQADVVNLVADLSTLTTAVAGKANTSHAHAESDVTNLVTDLAGKASKTSGNIYSGLNTFNNGMEHAGGTWGFNGSIVPFGKRTDPPNISTGTIDATWGTTEAAVMEDIRTSLNSVIQTLRDIGILTA
jgi:hypothetical protein